jgi:hypothetical protein
MRERERERTTIDNSVDDVWLHQKAICAQTNNRRTEVQRSKVKPNQFVTLLHDLRPVQLPLGLTGTIIALWRRLDRTRLLYS